MTTCACRGNFKNCLVVHEPYAEGTWDVLLGGGSRRSLRVCVACRFSYKCICCMS